MNRKLLNTLIITSFVLAACNLEIQMDDETPTPTVSPTETATAVFTPTESVSIPTASETPELAPFCEPNLATLPPPAECHVPLAEDVGTYCQDKRPYSSILINPGSNYKMVTEGFRCTDGGMKNDRQLIVCSGPMAMTFELTVCDASCIIPAVEAKATQCPQDYNYNKLQGCCTKELPQENESCKTLKFKTTSCVVNCREYKTDGRCRKQSFACEWDGQAEACVQRK